MSSNTIDMPARAEPATHRHYHLDVPQAASSALADVFAFEGERAIGVATPERLMVSTGNDIGDLQQQGSKFSG